METGSTHFISIEKQETTKAFFFSSLIRKKKLKILDKCSFVNTSIKEEHLLQCYCCLMKVKHSYKINFIKLGDAVVKQLFN